MRIATLVSLVLASTPAFAEPFDFHPMADGSREKDIVAAKMPDVSSAKGAKVLVALAELDTSKNASLVVRVETPGSCQGEGKTKSCRTAILSAGTDDWKIVFDRPALTVELGEPGFGTMRRIMVNDGYEQWVWNGYKYAMNVDSIGKTVKLAAAPAASVPMLIQQFGPSYAKLSDKKHALVPMVAAVDLKNDGKSQVLVRLQGPGACGPVLGCPWRVLEVKNQAYETVLNGYGTDNIAVLPFSREGWKDVGANTPNGFVVFGWSGKAYAVSDEFDATRRH